MTGTLKFGKKCGVTFGTNSSYTLKTEYMQYVTERSPGRTTRHFESDRECTYVQKLSVIHH